MPGVSAIAALVVVGLGIVAATRLSPVPGALLVRAVFNQDARRTARALNEATPEVERQLGIGYRDADPDALLDVYTPKDAEGPLPTIVWTHGGAWLSGDRSDYAGYFGRLADAGFTVVAPGYSLAPGHQYPRALGQVNDAIGYALDHADELNVDPMRIVLAGDSAGAQLSAQLATAVVDRKYAESIGLEPTLGAQQLRGVILNCGIYDVHAMNSSEGLIGWGVSQALWAYTGEREFRSSAAADQMSVLNHAGTEFPSTWISGGNADPLTKTQSLPLAKRLGELGVGVQAVFYPDDYEPPLGHEYQFKLETEAARDALLSMTEFARSVTE